MQNVEVRFTREPGCEDMPLPRYMSEHASGMDLCAAVREDTTLAPGQTRLIPTGLRIAVPPGHEAQIRPRSGMALKHSVSVLNAPGTIDADYRGEVCVILANHGTRPFTVTRGMRIAQMVIAPVVRAELIEVDALDETDRSSGGFGHTGISGAGPPKE